jgi:hypothetical protein
MQPKLHRLHLICNFAKCKLWYKLVPNLPVASDFEDCPRTITKCP